MGRLSCPSCGYSKDAGSERPISEGPYDLWFRLPLWLRTPCRGETLWAYDADHLAVIAEYLNSRLRMRLPNVNRSVPSRLPAWAKNGKARDDVRAACAGSRSGCTKTDGRTHAT